MDKYIDDEHSPDLAYSEELYFRRLKEIKFSQYQTAIFDFVKQAKDSSQSRSLSVNAVAGSGKTFTITHAAKFVPAGDECLFLAFNKKLVLELERKLPNHVPAKTTHAVGYAALRDYDHSIRLPPDQERSKRSREMLNNLLSVPEKKLIREQIVQMLALAKNNGLVPAGISENLAKGVVPDTPEFWSELIARYDIDFEDDAQETTAIERTRQLLSITIDCRDRRIDFDDMLYLPIVYRAPLPKFQWLFVDEAQDLNRIQHELISRIISPDSVLVAVGDPHQSIYGFRGAMNDSMTILESLSQATRLPLSICYRCAKQIVREAQQFVPHIEYAPDAPEGTVLREFRAESLAAFSRDAVVLCPRNAPLISAAYIFIRNHISCHVLGRDIGKGLVTLVRRMERRGADNVGQVDTALNVYLEEESTRLADRPMQLQSLEDKAETLRVFLREVPRDKSVPDLVREIEAMFVDEENSGVLTLSTIHKAKGMEWTKVFLLDSESLHWRTSRKGIKLPAWRIQQQDNLHYVAITRAQHELIYVSSAQIKKFAD